MIDPDHVEVLFSRHTLALVFTQRLPDFIAELMTHLLKPPISVTYPGFCLLQDVIDDYGDDTINEFVVSHLVYSGLNGAIVSPFTPSC